VGAESTPPGTFIVKPRQQELDACADMAVIMNRITVAGCLAMVFVHTTAGAQQAEFLRDIGASPFHFGILGAIPPLSFITQFAAAWLANHLEYRKRFWMILLILRRLSVCLLVLLPWILPTASTRLLAWAFIGIFAAGQMMGMFSQPLFFSWMGDLLPRQQISEYWASRRKWLSWTHALVMVSMAMYFYCFRHTGIRITYMLIVFVGSAAGVLDILLFHRIPEPKPVIHTQHILRAVLQPFREMRFRRLILFSCMLAFGMTTSAPFINLYMLQELRMPVHAVVLLMTVHALGGVLFAQRIGRLADRVGHRPLIVLSSALKPLIVVAFFFARPGPSVLALIPVLLVDNMLNTTLDATRTGFMLKQSPGANRPMFIAAVLAPAGVAGAAGSLLGGTLVEHLPDLSLVVGGVQVTAFRTVLALSAALRFAAFLASRFIHEPESLAADRVLRHVFGSAATRFSRLTLSALYSRKRGEA
jgi:MFS family permease